MTEADFKQYGEADKIKFADYQQIARRRRTANIAMGKAQAISHIAKRLLATISLQEQSIRLLGIALSNLDYLQRP